MRASSSWRSHAGIGLALLCGLRMPAHAQNRGLLLRYSAPQINCAQILESAESAIQVATEGRIRKQTAGRAGVWQFHAKPSVDGVALEGWLDSLSLWRKSQEGTIRPDTDGLLGGRYRGVLSGRGFYAGLARPFVPDEVAEVAGMGTALDDFFPPLSPIPLHPGQAWGDSAGLTIRRMADSGMSGVPLYRFELEIRREQTTRPAPQDTISLRRHEVSREHGTFVWHPLLGLLQRDRRIVIETSVPAGHSIRQPVRSRIEQRILLRRNLAIPPEHDGHC